MNCNSFMKAYPSEMLMSRTTVTLLTNPGIHAMMNEVQRNPEVSTAQKLEKHFFLSLIRLVNEVQGMKNLPSQIHVHRKSTWVKQCKSSMKKKDALSSLK